MLCKAIWYNTWGFSLDEISAWVNTLGFLCKFLFMRTATLYFCPVYTTLKLNAYFLGWKNLFEEPLAKKKKRGKNAGSSKRAFP